jgi:hypothetical protein
VALGGSVLAASSIRPARVPPSGVRTSAALPAAAIWARAAGAAAHEQAGADRRVAVALDDEPDDAQLGGA